MKNSIDIYNRFCFTGKNFCSALIEKSVMYYSTFYMRVLFIIIYSHPMPTIFVLLRFVFNLIPFDISWSSCNIDSNSWLCMLHFHAVSWDTAYQFLHQKLVSKTSKNVEIIKFKTFLFTENDCTQGCFSCFWIWQPWCCNLVTESSIVKLDIFEFIHTHNGLTCNC